MPEGLAQDLEIFDGVQLKAELESIALSHPEVRVLEAACSGLPCRAEAASTNGEELIAFAGAVHRRFQGYVSIRMPPPRRVPGQRVAGDVLGGDHALGGPHDARSVRHSACLAIIRAPELLTAFARGALIRQ